MAFFASRAYQKLKFNEKSQIILIKLVDFLILDSDSMKDLQRITLKFKIVKIQQNK